MIASKLHTDVQVESTISGQVVKMGIDPMSVGHIMNVLTDLYSDPEMAVIREYSTNAHDAHIEAGLSDPIEVTLPTSLDRNLRIRDYGPGLDVQDIKEIYSQYGASTKRSTNDQVGMLGLGCKSALTYAPVFSLVAIKDGVRVQVAIGRDDDGAGSMTVVDSCTTDERSGVEIVIPAKEGNDMKAKARDFFRFWEPGSVLVNGEQPERVSGYWLTDTLLVTDEVDEDTVVMGHVPYPTDLDSGLAYTHQLVAFVPIGAVTFPADREALTDNAHTRATLEQVAADFAAAGPGAVQRAIDAATTPSDAIAAMAQWHSVLPTSAREETYTWQGHEMPTRYAPQKISSEMNERLRTVQYHSYYLNSCSNVNAVGIEVVPSALWAYGDFPQKWTASHKRKLVKWCEQNGRADDAPLTILCEVKPHSFWIDPKNVVEWADIKAIQLERKVTTAKGTTRLSGAYEVFEDGEYVQSKFADALDTTKPLYYYHGNYFARSAERKFIQERKPKCTIVMLSANRIDKFCRDFPKAVELITAVKDYYDQWTAKIGDDARMALVVQDDTYATMTLKCLDASQIDDPDVRHAISLAHMDLTTINRERRIFRNLMYASSTRFDLDWDNPLDKYPLVSDRRLHGLDVDHAHLYINAVYAANQQEA